MDKQGRNDQRLLTLIGCIEGAVLEYDGDTRCLDVWTIDPKILIMPRESVIGTRIEEVLGEAGTDLAAAVRRVHRTGDPESTQTRLHLNGKDRWLVNDIKRVEGEDDAHTVVVLARDITDRKEAEDALRISEERYRLLASATNDVLWDWDFVTNVITWGEAAQRVFMTSGAPSLEWWMEAMHPDDRQRSFESFQASLASGETAWSDRYRMLRGDGVYIDLLVRAFIVRHDDAVVRVVGSWVDISETSRLQAQLVQADRLAALGMLAAGVGHEINNPLCYVLGNLDLALEPDGLDASEMREVIQEAREGAGRIAEIVKGLKLFSRSEPTLTANVSLDQVIDRSLKMAENDIRHRARIVRDFGKVPRVCVSESRLGQVCLNLIINAAQAIPLGSAERNEIRVSTGVDERGRAFFSVTDTGAGIAPELLDRIFDPFFTTKAVGVGTGIGLSVCMNIVQSMDGELTVTSVPNRTTFTVSLPLVDDAPATIPAPTPLPPEPPKRKLLIIDDEPAVGRSIARALKNVCDSTMVTGGAAALSRIAAGEKFDLVLCDVMMPEMNGIELYEILRERHTNIIPRMFFMTGGVFSDEAADFLDALSHPPLQKPIDNEKLKSVMK